ncbi:helix-turn-helix transcriptional regulator [Mangrovicoccus sp. HB161399]|uniref:helix-turn-helix transcriptional regulator n=1 Tax=Mangrovicoccus sp. HB161399 TaxID=2720392 RepID=UPI0015555370|nr:helix-turn-helix transcriptional regulator [Mangrovicoccus sp. HB161399]
MTLDNLQRSLAAMTDAAELWPALFGHFREHGAVWLQYSMSELLHAGDEEPAAPMVWSAAPAWEGVMLARLRGDPLAEMALARGTPSGWGGAGAPGVARQPESYRRLPGPGLVFGVFGPGLRHGLVFAGFAASPAKDTAAALQLAAQAAHQRHCAISGHPVEPRGGLSRREREVLDLIALGKSNGVMAELLGLSRHTVDTLVRRIFAKFGVRDRTALVLAGIASGILQAGSGGIVTRLRD